MLRYALRRAGDDLLPAAVIAGGAVTLASGLLAARWITGTRNRRDTGRDGSAQDGRSS